MSPDFESTFDVLDDEAANVTRARPVTAARREGPAERTLPIIRKPVPVSESGPLRAPSADAPRGTFDDDVDFLGERPGTYQPPRGTPVAAGADPDGRGGGRLRAALLLLGLAFLGAGAIVAVWSYLPMGGLVGSTPERTAGAGTSDGASTVTDAAPASAVERPSPGPSPEPAVPARRSLGERFRDELERVEALVADGRLDEAGRVLATMDRAVYGYGIAEFSALETRIAARVVEAPTGGVSVPVEPGTDGDRAAPRRGAEQERATRQAALDAEAERREAARREAEQLAAARREAERLADAERRAESERLAESKRRADAERAAADERELLRRERLDTERKAREAGETRARAEARQLVEALAAGGGTAADAPVPDGGGAAAVDADATTAAAAAAAAAAEEALRVADEREADRRATDRRIAEQRAAAAAEERRIAALETAVAPRRRAQIDDEDLQIVYASLLELKRAVEDRDIASVIALSDPPSGRVQQLLQIFANSASIRTRITNVSARPADDTVTGTLRIEDIRRADGSRIRTPSELESVALTSIRQGDGWSSLSW